MEVSPSKLTQLKKKRIWFCVGIGFCIGILAWAPWLTEEFAIERVETYLGGKNAPYYYLGENFTVGTVPKTVIRIPFAALVYFPSEALYVVLFIGIVV